MERENAPEMTAWEAITVAEVARRTIGYKDQAGAIDCFDARDIGRLEEEGAALGEDLKGILYMIPAEGATGAGRVAG